jgi:hypothetical protein
MTGKAGSKNSKGGVFLKKLGGFKWREALTC